MPKYRPSNIAIYHTLHVPMPFHLQIISVPRRRRWYNHRQVLWTVVMCRPRSLPDSVSAGPVRSSICRTPFGPRVFASSAFTLLHLFLPPAFFHFPSFTSSPEIPLNSQLLPCHCDHLEGSRPCNLPPTQRSLVPCVALDRQKTLDEVFPGVHLSIAAGLVAAHGPIRAADLSVAAAAAVAAEVVDATEVQVTVERRVREVLHAARR